MAQLLDIACHVQGTIRRGTVGVVTNGAGVIPVKVAELKE